MEKEKLLNMSKVSSSHAAFNRLVMQTRTNYDLVGEGLSTYAVHICKHNSFIDPIYCGVGYTSPVGCNQLSDSSLVFSVYLSSLPVAHLSDAPRRRLVVTGDSARIQDETTESSAWFFNVLGV